MKRRHFNPDLPPGLRPIGARALKSAIDSLRPWLADADVVDLFSGQGRFGLAALEEEVASVLFVEKAKLTAGDLRKASARFEKARIWVGDVFQFLVEAKENKTTFDVVFADPPFAVWSDHFSRKLFESVADVCRPEAIFLVKHPARVIASPPNKRFSVWKTSPFGESKLMYFKYGTVETES